nr:RecName: Full=Short cationic peptide-1e; Short=SCP-1e; AltName: Full=Cupiennin 1-like peptide-1e; AltName: Full=Truncated variant of Cupiennin 1 family [Cupiennius salei]
GFGSLFKFLAKKVAK